MPEVMTNNLKETQEIAGKFINDLIKDGKKADNALVVALEGELGSGKTSFVQGVAAALGIKEHATSPTFVLIKRYRLTPPFSLPLHKGRVARPPSLPARHCQSLAGGREGVSGRGVGFSNFYHIDCYRIEKSWQLQELGFEEIINNPENIVAIEWPERISEILPKDAIKIKFEFVDENKRKIVFM